MKLNDTELPVVLFVFNRHKQLQETLDCIRANKVPRLYVYADGPRNENDNDDIKKVREIIDQVSWTKITKIYHKKNMGLSESIRYGLNDVFKTYSRAVVIEDDICPAPGFYEYMQSCLNKYQNNPEIAGVTGLRYPFSKKNLRTDPYDVFITPRFASWGWGTWEDRWRKISFNENSLIKRLESKGIDSSRGGNDLPSAVKAIKEGTLTGCWDVIFYMNMLLQNTYFVWPKQNYIINTGLSEGSHASNAAAPNWKLKLEKQPSRKLSLPDLPEINAKLLADFMLFFEPSNLNKVSKEKRMRESAAKVKHYIRKAVKGEQKITEKKPDPADYSTTDNPMEVPCQKEVYYHVLNNYVEPNSKVLDVGLGLGYGMAVLSVKAKNVEGVDVDKKAVKFASKEYLGKNPKITSIKAYDGYNLPYKDKSFDVVTCVDVLEHVEDYHRFIDELLRVSKKYVVFGTPNRRPEYTNADGSPKNYYHLREWTQPELSKILQKHAATVAWRLIDGPFDGPFTVKKKSGKDTLVLMPVLTKKKSVK